ncbi:serine-tRNA ligase [Wallemia mellicola]|nr:serine-tRNA ligase [Wallemia mellicola]TIB84700.1 serine-tRNA ligase [Wallemia mellicola]TIC38754.1 serine-tRNA ligase [Wallemia mellicola]TIC46248.1 serine-tRNA ligase [Wallemia mellicola]TIC52303.1 serine-tRNA ligase [Wallemia mellicola]
MIDLVLLQEAKGGNPELVKESQKKRYASVELVDEVLKLYQDWTSISYESQQLNTQINQTQKAITAKKKNKESADDELAKKKELDSKVAGIKQQALVAEQAMKAKAVTIGNIVHTAVPIDDNEDNNVILRLWHPEGPNAQVEKKEGILAHHEVLQRLDGFDLERGQKIAGHRGYFLQDTAVDLNLALISYGLDFLRKRQFKKVMTPFMMRKDMMSKTAQLEQFDEELYKIEDVGGEDDKYLIATSEQPISAMFANEWFEKPQDQLPIRMAGYSTCFRKEAGKHGKDTWGIFRVHQFEKIEQFCVTSPEKSWEMFDEMVNNSEEFYQSLGIPYRLVNIVSGALNNAAAQKYDLEAWFPYLGEWKELVSTSNCTDYQSRSLEVRHGIKKQGETNKTYVHMLNGTMCATERAMCCLVENWQNEEGLVVPPVLRKYMDDKEFIPFVKELPKTKANKSKK